MLKLVMPNPRKIPLPPLPNKFSIKGIGNRLSNFRKMRGHTQKELAELIGISRSHLSNYESELIHLNDEMIIRFSLALNISADKILGLKTNKFAWQEKANSVI